MTLSSDRFANIIHLLHIWMCTDCVLYLEIWFDTLCLKFCVKLYDFFIIVTMFVYTIKSCDLQICKSMQHCFYVVIYIIDIFVLAMTLNCPKDWNSTQSNWFIFFTCAIVPGLEFHTIFFFFFYLCQFIFYHVITPMHHFFLSFNFNTIVNTMSTNVNN